MLLPLPVPNSEKNLFSAYWIGRSSSIEIQYLYKYKFHYLLCLQNESKYIPNNMNPFMQLLCLRTFRDKVFHFNKFIGPASFKSTRIMENERRVTSKHHLILNVVMATLNQC